MNTLFTVGADRPKHAQIPQDATVIEVAPRRENAIGVVFGDLCFAFNLMHSDGRSYVSGADIRSAALKVAVHVRPRLAADQIGRMSEFIRLRIIRSLLRDEFVIFGDDTSDHDCFSRLGALGEVFDELAA